MDMFCHRRIRSNRGGIEKEISNVGVCNALGGLIVNKPTVHHMTRLRSAAIVNVPQPSEPTLLLSVSQVPITNLNPASSLILTCYHLPFTALTSMMSLLGLLGNGSLLAPNIPPQIRCVSRLPHQSLHCLPPLPNHRRCSLS